MALKACSSAVSPPSVSEKTNGPLTRNAIFLFAFLRYATLLRQHRRCEQCLTLEHAKKLAVQTAEELARKKDCSQLRGKHVQVTDERGNLVYKVSLPDGMPASRKLNGVRLDKS